MDDLVFEPLTGCIGAMVHGVDVSNASMPQLADQIHAGLMEHIVLVLPKQDMTAQHHVDLGRALGDLEPRHPLYPIVDNLENIMLIENGPERPPDNEIWHSDMTFRPIPPHCSLLQAKVLQPRGGDTMFANMYAIFEDLPEEIQTFLSTLTAVHDVKAGFQESLSHNQETDRLEALAKMDRADSHCVHPVVAKHPVSGRRYINVNEVFTDHIVQLPGDEGKGILHMLYERVRHPRYQVRHRWAPNDLVIWDNLASQHFAVGDYTEYRRMHRVTVKSYGPQYMADAA